MIHNDMDFFHQAALKICGSLDTDLILSRCRRFLKGYLPVDSIVMGYYDPEKKALHNFSRASNKSKNNLVELVYVPEKLADHFKKTQKNSNFVKITNQPGDNPIAYEWWNSLGMTDGSFLSMQLFLDGELIGFIALFSKGFGRYKKEDGRLFSLLHAPFAVALNNGLQHRELVRLKDLLKDDNRYLNKQLQRRAGEKIIGAGSGLKKVMELVGKVAPLSSQVMLLGETGVGKEVIANAIHHSSPRANRPFIKVNCGAIPENLIDSELFGHEKGAFTGAVCKKRGRFERAHKGTIFLDEIGELPLPAQVRLLRVIQNRKIERVGGLAPISVDIRIIAATHRDLEQMVVNGEFREDLWFRLNVLPITIPPLRERTQDIPDLIHYFIKKKAREMNYDCIPLPGPGFTEALQKNVWKGNIRELENTIERVLIHHLGSPEESLLYLDKLSNEEIRSAAPVNDETMILQTLDSLMADHIRTVIAHTKGKIQGKSGAAEILGIHPSTLRCRMKKLGIPYGRSKKCCI